MLPVKPVVSGENICLFEAVFFFKIIHQKRLRRYSFSNIIDDPGVFVRADGEGRGKMADPVIANASGRSRKPEAKTLMAAQAAFGFAFKAGYATLPIAVVISAFDKRDAVYAADICCNLLPAVVFLARLDVRVIEKARDFVTVHFQLLNGPARANAAADM